MDRYILILFKTIAAVLNLFINILVVLGGVGLSYRAHLLLRVKLYLLSARISSQRLVW